MRTLYHHFTAENVANVLEPVLVLTACGLYLGVSYSLVFRVSFSNPQTPEDVVDNFNDADTVVQLWVAYVTIMSVALLFVLFRTVMLLDFHPTAAVISGTLSRAAEGLWYFFLVFGLVVLIYAFVGVLLLGRTRLDFASFGSAVNTLLFLAIGEVQDTKDYIFTETYDPAYVRVIQALFFWSYIFVVTILLMNVLLSIIVGAFVEMQETSTRSIEAQPIYSLGQSFLISVHFWLDGASVVMRRSWRRCRKSRCCHESPAEVPDKENRMEAPELRTPWERLISLIPDQFNEDHVADLGRVRKHLMDVLISESAVEKVIRWCRLHSAARRMRKYEHNLQGMDPTSLSMSGRQIYLLETVVKHLKPKLRYSSAVTGTSEQNLRSYPSSVSMKQQDASLRNIDGNGESEEDHTTNNTPTPHSSIAGISLTNHDDDGTKE
jgi:hypothetical protein